MACNKIRKGGKNPSSRYFGILIECAYNLDRQRPLWFLLIFLTAACGGRSEDLPSIDPPAAAPDVMIPLPVSDTPTGQIFTLTEDTNIYFSPEVQALREVGEYLIDRLRPATGYEIDVFPRPGDNMPIGSICLTLEDADPSLGKEGYELNVTREHVFLSACNPEGVFRGLQTLRQLLPPEIEESTVQPRPWQVVTRKVRDFPRFAWRGAMLDVARHFFSVEEVKRIIDLLAYHGGFTA